MAFFNNITKKYFITVVLIKIICIAILTYSSFPFSNSSTSVTLNIVIIFILFALIMNDIRDLKKQLKLDDELKVTRCVSAFVCSEYCMMNYIKNNDTLENALALFIAKNKLKLSEQEYQKIYNEIEAKHLKLKEYVEFKKCQNIQ